MSRQITTTMRAVDVSIPISPQTAEYLAPFIAASKAHMARLDLELMASCGVPEAVAELARIVASEDAARAERKAFRALRRRWREAYQAAKWGE